MPSETEQLKVKVSLIDESKIAILIDNYEEFQKYTINGQKSKNTFVYCMQGDKLLRIQINNISNQEDNTNRLEVKSVSIYNDTNGGEEAKEVGKITKLLDFSDTDKSKEIEIFKSLGYKVKKLAGEKGELQTQLNEAKQEKNEALEAAKKEAEQEKKELEAENQKLKEAEELNNFFVKYLKEKCKKLQDQAQQLTQLFQEENKEQETEVQKLAQRLGEINKSLENGDLNAKVIEELNELWEKKEEISNKLNGNALFKELRIAHKQINILNAQVTNLQQQLEAKNQEIAKLKQQPSNAKVTNLEKELAAKNTEVEKLKKEKKELEAKKQPTEQPKQGNGAQYTAAAGFGLAAGLAAFIALERTVRLDIWTMVGIALVAALAVSGATYLALKPSTQMNEAEAQEVNGEVPAKS